MSVPDASWPDHDIGDTLCFSRAVARAHDRIVGRMVQGYGARLLPRKRTDAQRLEEWLDEKAWRDLHIAADMDPPPWWGIE